MYWGRYRVVAHVKRGIYCVRSACFSESFAVFWFDTVIVSLEAVVRYVPVVVSDAVKYPFFMSMPRAIHVRKSTELQLYYMWCEVFSFFYLLDFYEGMGVVSQENSRPKRDTMGETNRDTFLLFNLWFSWPKLNFNIGSMLNDILYPFMICPTQPTLSVFHASSHTHHSVDISLQGQGWTITKTQEKGTSTKLFRSAFLRNGCGTLMTCLCHGGDVRPLEFRSCFLRKQQCTVILVCSVGRAL